MYRKIQSLVITDPKFNSSVQSWMSFTPINIRRETNVILQFKTYTHQGLLFYTDHENDE